MMEYSKYSFWLETCSEDLAPRRSLEKSTDVDVAILGGGYTGLWTAYYLLRSNPRLRVAVIEKEIVGYGASGRNGGGVRRSSRLHQRCWNIATGAMQHARSCCHEGSGR